MHSVEPDLRFEHSAQNMIVAAELVANVESAVAGIAIDLGTESMIVADHCF